MLSSSNTQDFISFYTGALVGNSPNAGIDQADALLAMQRDLITFNGYFNTKQFNEVLRETDKT